MGIILGTYSPFQEEDVLLDANDFQDGDVLVVDTIDDQKVFIGRQPAEKILYFQINQTGTSVPTVTIIKNEFEVDYINASYVGVGHYTLNFTNIVVDAPLIAKYFTQSEAVFNYTDVFKGFIYVNLDASASEFNKLVVRTSTTAGVASNNIITDPITIGIRLIS